MPNLVRSVTRLIDQDDVASLLSALVDGYSLAYDAVAGGFVLRPGMTPDVVPGGFAVPSGYTCLYNNMAVPGGITVEVAGLLVDPGWSS